MPRVLFMGSFPPRECGIATFTKDLVEGHDAFAGSHSGVVAIDDPAACGYLYDSRVIVRIKQADRDSYAAAAALVNRHECDVVNVQHEYGLFGGVHGEWCNDFIGALNKPVVLTLHTVLPRPDMMLAAATRRLCAGATRVIVLAEIGRRLLVERYGIEGGKIAVIHHGVPDVPYQETRAPKAALGYADRTVVSTFGLISNDKGLEYAIAAVHEVVQQYPNVLYLILGVTHPLVRRKEGERYRESLQNRIAALGLQRHVVMVGRFLPLSELIAYLQVTDIYLTPYLNADQIVSGTLAYALGAGKAIVSTPYLYARELLEQGRGLLAEFQNAHSIAVALDRFLSDASLCSTTQKRAYAFGRRMIWSAVVADYVRLFATLSARRKVRSAAAAVGCYP
ncbi:MAG: glycosyltransferase family 4 protein [Candidatus Tumulicola sp.]